MVDLSLHLMDIMQNSVKAEASLVEVGVKADKKKDLLTLSVRDNGCGMSAEILEKVRNPFFTTRTTRKVGLGIPLFSAAAEMAGGRLSIESEPGKGTLLTADFEIGNIDRKPLGDVADTIATYITAYPELEFRLILASDDIEYAFRTEDVREQIGAVPINDIVIISFIKEMIREQINLLFGGILNEIIS